MSDVIFVGKIRDLPNAPGCFIKNATKKIVFGPKHFSDEFVMRCWTLEPEAGEKDQHKHGWPHWCVAFRRRRILCYRWGRTPYGAWNVDLYSGKVSSQIL